MTDDTRTYDEQRVQNERLRHAYQRRLDVLEVRAAEQGDATDPAVITEIAKLKANIAGLDMFDAPAPAPRITRAVRTRYGDDVFAFLVAQIADLKGEQGAIKAELRGDIAGVKAEVKREQEVSLEWRQTHTRRHDADAELTRMRAIGFSIWLFILAVAVIYLLIKLF